MMLRDVLFVLELRAIVGAKVGSGTMNTAPVADVFGWTAYSVMAPSRTLPTAHTEAGVFIAAITQKLSRYRAFQLRLRLHKVRANI